MLTKKKRVIFLGPVPPPYMGPTISTELILKSSLKNEFDLIHLDTSDHRDLNKLNKADIWNFLLAFKHYYLLILSIIKCDPELVYIPICQTTLGYFRDAIFILIAKIFNRKVISHLRGGNFRNWYLSSSPLVRWVVRQIHSLVDGQIVLGENLKSLFRGILTDEKLFVVPNGGNFHLNVKKGPFHEDEKVRILFLSNLIKEKGIFDILSAVPEVISFTRNVEFIFAGEWQNHKTKEEYNRFMKENEGLPIRTFGPLSGKVKLDLLTSVDIFILPTYYPPEGHPWVIIEAMAAGLPIITTDQGVIKELVIDGINGFIIEKRSPQQIAEKVKFLISHPDVRNKMGQESRRLYLENFTEEKMVEKLIFAFNSVLSR